MTHTSKRDSTQQLKSDGDCRWATPKRQRIPFETCETPGSPHPCRCVTDPWWDPTLEIPPRPCEEALTIPSFSVNLIPPTKECNGRCRPSLSLKPRRSSMDRAHSSPHLKLTRSDSFAGILEKRRKNAYTDIAIVCTTNDDSTKGASTH